jgi:hypothetical protein
MARKGYAKRVVLNKKPARVQLRLAALQLCGSITLVERVGASVLPACA